MMTVMSPTTVLFNLVVCLWTGQTQAINCETNDGVPGFCRIPSSCVGINLDYIDINICDMVANTTGVCCVDIVENVLVDVPRAVEENVELPEISEDAIYSILEEEEDEAVVLDQDIFVSFIGSAAQDDYEYEYDIALPDPEKTAETTHTLFNKPREGLEKINQDASFFLEKTKKVQESQHLTSKQAGIGLRKDFNKNTSKILDERCTWRETTVCDEKKKYRSYNGTCNNLKEPNYGRTGTPLQRMLPAEYSENTISLPRENDGEPLPGARSVSNSVSVGSNNRKDETNTVLTMQMGQFVDHDIAHVPVFPRTSCCQGGTFPDDYNTEECFPIRIPEDDTFWRSKGGSKTCMDFVRSMKSIDLNCSLGAREQPNQLTHWLDGSNIYGSFNHEAHELRDPDTRRKGRMMVTERTTKTVLGKYI